MNNWLNGEESSSEDGTEWKTNQSSSSKENKEEKSGNKNYNSLDDAFADLMG